ncbi:hypothetical protein DdX_14670 [Ditylenchus destructor]|uniref:F-box domain-containing protein n=1 Tax=Ditylenchus destructor TaxID=166010 RepID=A0AAD4MU81_9BILA|nr:hypothetical protein DdX_14670 [Ditylenchus destructor]
MSSLPNEIFSDITNFLPNDDITDLMLMSRNFNAHVTPRLKKIDQEMATTDQSIESFMPSPEPDPTDNEWISQLNLKKFLQIGTEAKKRLKEFLMNEKIDFLTSFLPQVFRYKEKMSLERFDDKTFLYILCVLIAMPNFRQEYNISQDAAKCVQLFCSLRVDTARIWWFYNSNV